MRPFCPKPLFVSVFPIWQGRLFPPRYRSNGLPVVVNGLNAGIFNNFSRQNGTMQDLRGQAAHADKIELQGGQRRFQEAQIRRIVQTYHAEIRRDLEAHFLPGPHAKKRGQTVVESHHDRREGAQMQNRPDGTLRTRVTTLLKDAGFTPGAMWVKRAPGETRIRALVEVEGLVEDDDPRLAALVGLDAPPVAIGGFAVPLEADRLRLPRDNVAPENVNQPLVNDLERVTVGASASASTATYSAPGNAP